MAGERGRNDYRPPDSARLRALGSPILEPSVGHCDQEVLVAGGPRTRQQRGDIHRWESSPFVRINARRKALAGRDLLRAFGLRIRLDAPRETTEIDSGV